MLQEKSEMNQLKILNKFGFFTAILTTALTIVTFGIAVLTPPLSGPFCTGSCFEYPYTDIAHRFPRDYIWMYPGILLMLMYVVFTVCIHQHASKERKLFSQLGVAFSIMSATTLVVDYFIQVSVIQPSLLRGETDGLSILTQYNPHGVFIVLEEAGYLLMSCSFLFTAFVYSRKDKLENAVRLTFIIGFALAVLSLVLIAIAFGINREYRFEIAVISIDFLVLIITGILQSRIFKRALRQTTS
jgi:hypothetical protein